MEASSTAWDRPLIARRVLAFNDDVAGREIRIPVWLGAISLLLPLLVAGCADNSSAADRDKPGGFYTGVSSGASHP